MTQSDKNHKFLRNRIKECRPPVVPFIGLYLKDLTFVEDGNSTFLENGTLVNMDKCYKISDIISSIQIYQEIGYHLEYKELPDIQDWIANLELLEEDYLFQRSLLVEPRKFDFADYEKLLLKYDELNTDPLPDQLVSILNISKYTLILIILPFSYRNHLHL